MLGSQARWLRFFGFDCAYPGVVDDAVVAAFAKEEGRWLLTRDRELAAVGPRTVLIRADTVDEQLLEVFSRHRLRPDSTLEHARCSACNGKLQPVDREQAAASVPPYVAATAERFRRCRDCGRVYWPGTHSVRILQRMQRVCEQLEDNVERAHPPTPPAKER